MRLKIGEFARMGQLSVSALRYYDEVGLLRPAEVDRWTGYRYYAYEQLWMLNRLLALKDLGLSLEQIRQLLGAELPVEQIKGMLRLKQAELQEQADDIKERLARVQARIEQIEKEGKMPDYEVVVKSVEPVRVGIIKDSVPSMEVVNVTLSRLFEEVGRYIVGNGGQISGPPTALWYSGPSMPPAEMEVAVAFPTESAIPTNERVQIEELPAVDTMASVVHRGPFSTIGEAYAALMHWLEQSPYQAAGPTRELNLEFEPTGDPNKWVTEIQLPVAEA
ncbi:MAG: MerR family transcriptional regulator [Chloroflexota bacterium]